MAIEDHPKFPAWREAHAKLVEAFEQHKEAIQRREPEHIVKVARGILQEAQANYDAIADEIDYA